MSHITTTLTQLALLTTALVLALTLNYAFAAPWVGPPGVAPTNNVAMPLNVTNTPQVKDGNVSVGASGNTASDFGLISYGKIRSTIGGIQFPDGTVQVSAASGVQASTGGFGGSANFTLPGTFNLIEIQGLNGAPNGASTNVVTSTFVTVFNAGGTWKFTTLVGGAGTAYATNSGTLATGVQQCPIVGGGYTMQFCLTRTAGNTLQIVTGAATSQGAAYKYTMQ